MDFQVDSEEVWRSGNLLVMRKDAQLPDRCIKTNRPANGKRFRANLYWHHPAVYLLVLINLLVYVVVALIVRKNAIVYVGVTEEVLQKRNRTILGAWIVGIIGVFLLFAPGFTQLETLSNQLQILGFILILGGLFWGIMGANIVSPAKIDDDYIWLRGVCREYLASLPLWKN
ncbi:hypothetical protein ACE1B6_24620 [Aerosakkonemataceae cyanobacterium BLCC-F154]|uniref:Uncharacterized protein n=1 Tax=Floridaenema fluviatile BLCC-F154 TaxID=3153640 RepID=A0ABV4YJR9_9CYAN